MDPFEAFETANSNNNDNQFCDDPAAEFLAREQAEFAKIENINNDFSNKIDLNHGFEESSTDHDIFSNQFASNTSSTTNTVTTNSDNNRDQYSAISVADKLIQEPEKIKKWREEQKQRIQTKDAEEDQKKKEWKDLAKKELEEWYKNRQEQLVKTIENNRAAEAEIMATRENNASGHDWERIAKLCDFNPKANKNQRDVGRMRSILLQLKQQPLIR